eukprot:gene8214-9061_t
MMTAIDLLLAASANESPRARPRPMESLERPADSEDSPAHQNDAIHAILLLASQRAASPSPLRGDEDRLAPRRRPRAMSEPWNLADFSLQTMAAAAAQEEEGVVPDFLAKYADVINKNGRVGIYTKEERAAIVARFHEKRKRRVWQKRIRYVCRKSLADRRLRVKGRFVKMVSSDDQSDAKLRVLASLLGDLEEEEEELSTPTDTTQDRPSSSSSSSYAVEVSHAHASLSTHPMATRHRRNIISSASGDAEESEMPYKRVRRHSIAF